MRRIGLLLLVAASLSMLAAVPALAGPIGIHPGVKVGVAVANFDENVSSAEDLQSQSKMTFGGTMRLDVGRLFSIQPELQYMPDGGQGTFVVDNGGTPTTVDGVLMMDYLEFPVLAKFRFPGAGALMPNIYLGPSAALNLTSKLSGDLSAIGGTTNDEADVKDEVQKLLFGGAVGGGFDMRTGKGILSLDARYSRSLSDIFKGATSGGSASVFGAADSKTSTMTVTLGYAF
jgi:hypothetical protein